MRKAKYVLLLLIVFILIAIGIFITNNKNPIIQNNPIQVSNTKDSVMVQNVIKDKIPSRNFKVPDSIHVQNVVLDKIPSNWKTYTNKKFDYTFQYPSDWIYKGKDAEFVNRSGTTMVIESYFSDTISHTTLVIDHHLAPQGAELYQYIVAQYNSSQGWYKTGGKQIKVDGNKAIEAFTLISTDPKGHIINPPLRLILIDFLDMQQTGEIQIKFSTPLPNGDTEIAKFNQLLTTFKFTN